MIFLVDSHCHLNLLDLSKAQEDLNQLISRAQENGVHYILNVCVTISGFNELLKTAEKYPFVGASIGLHPNEDGEEVDQAKLIELGQHKKVIAVGETGLDYFRTSAASEWQRERFRTHIAAAKILRKPLLIHTRAAKEDTIAILREEDATTVGGVMHCFTEDWPMAKVALDLGFYISFSGIVTFKNAAQIQAVAKQVPLDRMLIETDAPYLSPVPYRSKQNEPSYVRSTAEFIAALRNVPLEKFAAETTENFFNLFKGALRPDV